MAFVLETTFLGMLPFGRRLAHLLTAVMIAAGTLFPSFWILATNVWMQTPAGYAVADGRFVSRPQIMAIPPFT